MGVLMDKVAIVTGASSGIGRAAALLFAHEGARVLLAARREAQLQALVEEIAAAGGQALAVAGDVGDEGLAQELVERASAQFGGLDVAFNNAGTLGELAAAPDVSLAAWETTLRTNLTSAFLAAKYQLPAMAARGGGSLIFTSSFVGHTVGFPGMSAYAASKAGLIGLTQCLASEWGAQGIRVNALLPGGTDTPMGRHVAHTPEALAQVQGPACAASAGSTGRGGPRGAVSGLVCLQLHHRQRFAGGWRCVDSPGLNGQGAVQRIRD